jgi:hypothetical protein
VPGAAGHTGPQCETSGRPRANYQPKRNHGSNCPPERRERRVTLKASYFDVASKSEQEREVKIVVRHASQVPDDAPPDLGISLQRARVSTADALAAGVQMADAGDLQAARIVLEQRLQKVMSLVTSAQCKGNVIVASIAGVLAADLEEGLRDLQVYSSHGSKAMRIKGACLQISAALLLSHSQVRVTIRR